MAETKLLCLHTMSGKKTSSCATLCLDAISLRFYFTICAGMMWMRQFSNSDMNLRHTCEQGDRLQGYGWLMHDGLTFGVQEIRDNDFTLTTEFVKRIGGDHGGDWTWRITAKQHVSLVLILMLCKCILLLSAQCSE